MACTSLIKVLSVSVLVFCGAYLLVSASSYSYFIDTDEISMSVTTGTWGEQSDDLTIDITGVLLTGHGSNGFHLHNIVLRNSGDKPVEITGIILRWNPENGEMLQRVWFCGDHMSGNENENEDVGEDDTFDRKRNAGKTFWEGNAACGASVGGFHCIGPAGQGNLHCWFDSDMSGKTIYLTFVFDDGSQKGVAVLV